MRAWTFTERGLPTKVLKLRHDVPQPQATDLRPNEVIVKVSHVALNAPIASLMAVMPHFTSNIWIPNYEFSGIITAIGEEGGSRQLREGDAVFGMIGPQDWMRYNGATAEYIIVPRVCVAVKPLNITFEQAAGLAGSSCTVVDLAAKAGLLVVEHGADGPRIRSHAQGKNILVTGGSTSTGISMLQLVRYLVGEEGLVVTTASPRNREAVLTYGADIVIDYTQHPDLHDYLLKHYTSEPFDAIIDISGSDEQLYRRSPAYLRPSGSYAFTGSMKHSHAVPDGSAVGAAMWFSAFVRLPLSWILHMIRPVVLGGIPRRCFFHSGQPTVTNLELVRQLAAGGIFKIIVDSVWDMEDALHGFDHVAEGKIRGKVIVKV